MIQRCYFKQENTNENANVRRCYGAVAARRVVCLQPGRPGRDDRDWCRDALMSGRGG